MSKFTPGPWEWWTSNSWLRLRSNPPNGKDVGVVVPFVAADGHPNLEVSAADMRLIAAAPDLLAIVKRLLDTRNAEVKALTLLEVLQNNYSDHRAELAAYEAASIAASECEAEARAVIAKAEGRA